MADGPSSSDQELLAVQEKVRDEHDEISEDEYAPALEKYERRQSTMYEKLSVCGKFKEKILVGQQSEGNELSKVVLESVREPNQEKVSATELEKAIKKAFKGSGDIDKINELITPYNLTKCNKNSLETSFEVSHELRKLAKSEGPDAEELKNLAMSVENFAINLIEPLKSDDMKRAIFQGEDFDRIADQAVKYEQKKFLSHPVVYNLLMRQWTGYFHHLCLGSTYDANWFFWVFLNIWTAVDVLFFAVIHVFLYLMSIIIRQLRKRREYCIVFLMKPCGKFAEASYQKMQDIVLETAQTIKEFGTKYYAIHPGDSEPSIITFDNTIVGKEKLSNVHLNGRKLSTSNYSLSKYLEKAKDKYETPFIQKILVFMTDDKCGLTSKQTRREIKDFKTQGVTIVSVGIGLGPKIKDLENMAESEKDVILYLSDEKRKGVLSEIKKSILGRDIFDQYVKYFTCPYFIFARDNLSYLALLALHFIICLQPSTIHFTFTEFAIMFFFLGRLLMEMDQALVSVEDNNNGNSNNKDLAGRRLENGEAKKGKGFMKKMWKKIKNRIFKMISNYLSDLWNILDAINLVIYIIILVIRLITMSTPQYVAKNRLLAVAGYLYGLNAMVLSIRVFGNIMESKKVTGSIQIALFQVMMAVIAISGQFLIAIMAFSLAFTKIFVTQISYDENNIDKPHGLCRDHDGFLCWWRSMVFLAWSLLGRGSSSSLTSSDSTSNGIAELLYVLFLILGTVMLMNMIIALLSNTYQSVEDNAFHEWSYKKASAIRTYRTYHPVPVPFNVISLTLLFVMNVLQKMFCIKNKRNLIKKLSTKKVKSNYQQDGTLFSSLLEDLQSEYFAVNGHDFPMTENKKMDLVLKETEGSRQLMGNIAKRVFRYDAIERQLIEPQGWESKGVRIVDQQLTYTRCTCCTCVKGVRKLRHGARYLTPLSKEFPAFEVLIEDSAERRLISIGVVTDGYDVHKFPGWDDNTVGYHINDGRIFDRFDVKNGTDAIAYRGDLIGCEVRYDKQENHLLPVTFTRNGRVVGEASLKAADSSFSGCFYPFVGIGCEKISLLFRISERKSSACCDTSPAVKLEEETGQMINQSSSV